MESEEKIKNDKDKKTQHIMFSYSWTQKNQVRHIYDIIDNEYSEVPKWIDINQMSGNIIEAMNKAVEDSFLRGVSSVFARQGANHTALKFLKPVREFFRF